MSGKKQTAKSNEVTEESRPTAAPADVPTEPDYSGMSVAEALTTGNYDLVAKVRAYHDAHPGAK